MLKDDQIPVTPQPGPRVHHTTVRSGQHGISRLTTNVVALVARLIEASEQTASGRPDKAQAVVRRCGRCWCRCRYCSWRRSCCARRHARRGHWPRHDPGISNDRGRHRSRRHHRAWRNHAQDLAHLDQVRVLQVVPPRNVFPRLAVFQADTDQRIPRPDAVVARLTRILGPGQRLRSLDHGARRCGRDCARGRSSVLDRSPVERSPATGHQQTGQRHRTPTHKTTRYQHKQSFSGNPRF